MKPIRTTTRRSFLRRVGATATAGAALALVGGSGARAQQGRRYTGVRDCDSGPSGDPDGYGRGVRSQYTDRDNGPGADRACQGRGSNSGSTGTEYSPYQNHTRPESGCSDTDYGQYGDPGGHGRRCRGENGPNNPPQLSGCTDRDAGPGSDSIGNGRHCR